MAVKQTLEVLEKVDEIATLAGLKGHLEEDTLRYFIGIKLDDARRQGVWVRDITRSPEHRVVTVYSPCLVIKKGLLSNISKERALELLRANEDLLFARYGIIESQKEMLIVASIDHLLDTLDPLEFEASVIHIAMAADAYEKKYGKEDQF